MDNKIIELNLIPKKYHANPPENIDEDQEALSTTARNVVDIDTIALDSHINIDEKPQSDQSLRPLLPPKWPRCRQFISSIQISIADDPERPLTTAEKTLRLIFKYFKYYLGHIIFFTRVPVMKIGTPWGIPMVEYISVTFKILAFIYCYTLPFIFVFVAFGFSKSLRPFGVLLNLVFFAHINLRVLGKILKEDIKEITAIFDINNKEHKWFLYQNMSLSYLKKKVIMADVNQDIFCISYMTLVNKKIIPPEEIMEESKVLLDDEIKSHMKIAYDPYPLLAYIINNDKKTVIHYKKIFYPPSILLFMVRIGLVIYLIENYYGYVPYQLLLTSGIFGTLFLDAINNQDLDLIGQISSLKQLKKLLSLSPKIDEKRQIRLNVCCPYTLSSWTRMIEILQIAALDTMKREDINILLYLLYFIIIIVVIVIDVVFSIDSSGALISNNLLLIYFADLFTLCYQIGLRLYLGLIINRTLVACKKQLKKIKIFLDEILGPYTILLNFEPKQITNLKRRYVMQCMQVIMDSGESVANKYNELNILSDSLSSFIDELNDFMNHYSYKFLGVVKCDKSFYISVMLSLLSIVGTGLISEIWKKIKS